MLRVLRLVGVVAVLFGGWGAAAFHGPALPVVDQVPLTGVRYVAWHIDLPPGGEYSWEVFGTTSTNSRAFAFRELDAATLQPQFWGFGGPSLVGPSLVAEGTVSLGVDAAASVRAHPCNLLAELATCPVGLAVDSWAVYPRDLIVMGIVAPDGPWQGNATLYLSPGSKVLGRTTGGAFFVESHGFQGGLSLRVGEELTGAVTVVRDAHHPVAVDGRLFGHFLGYAGFPGELEMGYRGPEGSGAGQDHYQFLGSPPGLYDLRIDRHVGVGSTIFAVGADVQLP